MAQSFSMKNAVDERLELAVATPGFLISVAEQKIRNQAISTGLREYFRYWPWRFRGSRVYKQSGEEIAITFEEIFANSTPKAILDNSNDFDSYKLIIDKELLNKIPESEHQKELLEIPVVKYKENDEDMEIDDNENKEENKENNKVKKKR